MSPARSASPWSLSRHQAALAAVPAGSPTTGSGSLERNATLKNAGGLTAVPEPPGCDASAVGCGSRYLLLVLSHRPTPAASRTTFPVGSHADCGTRTSTWRRVASSATVGAGPDTGVPSARASSATRPDPP